MSIQAQEQRLGKIQKIVYERQQELQLSNYYVAKEANIQASILTRFYQGEGISTKTLEKIMNVLRISLSFSN